MQLCEVRCMNHCRLMHATHPSKLKLSHCADFPEIEPYTSGDISHEMAMEAERVAWTLTTKYVGHGGGESYPIDAVHDEKWMREAQSAHQIRLEAAHIPP